MAKKSIEKAFKTSFAHILKTSKSLEFLMVFWRSRLPSGAQNGGLEGLRGATWGSLGDSWEAFWDFFCS